MVCYFSAYYMLLFDEDDIEGMSEALTKLLYVLHFRNSEGPVFMSAINFFNELVKETRKS